MTRLVTQHLDHALRDTRVRATQLPILIALISRPELSLAELADLLGADRTTLVRNLRPLTREKWIESKAAANTRRHSVRLTRHGRDKLASILPHWRSAQDHFLDAMGSFRWASIRDDLTRATETLRNRTEASSPPTPDSSESTAPAFSIEFD